MNDAPPAAPENLAASAFRASIRGHDVAIDFGNPVPNRSAGSEIELARRIVLDRAAAMRLLSALNVCLREHDARWRYAPPEQTSPGALRAPTPSHAVPDAAAPRAAHLFRVMDDLRLPYMYERSVRFTHSGMAANRFLLSLSRSSARDDFAALALRLAARVDMPADCREIAARHAGNARAVHLGFEGDDRILLKYYIEHDAAAQATSRDGAAGPATLHLAFKWDAADPARRVVSRYLLFPGLDEAQMLGRMAAIYRAAGNAESLEIAHAVLQVACTRVDADALQYLEVEEDGNERRSFDLNFYDAGLLVRDLQAPLARMRQHFDLKPGQFQALYDQIKPQTVGHLAGGIHRDGGDFFNVYYGVQRRQG
ncbi:MAG TPA: hypothetical protein VFV71_06480 [Burkholderiales bacterium]|nr:hypothetical protein [Burkholderiales bacterium]